jgi:LuxR family maltose regulon positive regulatory protein
MGLDLSPDVIAALEARTEGWIAGLQMAAIALQPLAGQRRASSRRSGGTQHESRSISAFVQAFTGSHRFVLDYLVEEVLEQQSPEIRDFLLKTSVLERMTASLCDAVCFGPDETPDPAPGTARATPAAPEPRPTKSGSHKLTGAGELPSSVLGPVSKGQAILAELDRANLFQIPLDDERRWYRYHTLFADLLRSRLEQTQPGTSALLHRRASDWYERNGLIAEAVSHALAGGDVERVASLVEGNALVMVSHGELTILMEWLNALPEEMVRSRPWLCLSHAWVLVFAGHFDAAELLLQDCEQTFGLGPMETAVPGS